MQYVVMDLEWNQSATGKPDEKSGLTFEIIEIGALKLNEQFEIIGEFQELVRPQLYPQIHEIIQEMVHISPEALHQARTFPEVVQDFLIWCGTECRICTWGSMDLAELQKNMDYYGIQDPFSRPLFYYDIQKLYSLCFDDGKSRAALETAVEQLKLEKTKEFHRAKEDCFYTVQVMQKLHWEKVSQMVSVDYHRLPQSREEEIYLVFPNYAKYVSRAFESKEEALKDKRVTAATCYRCRCALRKKISWFSPNGRTYFCLAECPQHGYLQGKLRVKRSRQGNIFVVKTLKLISPDASAKISALYQEAREKRISKKKEQRQRQ